MQERSVLAVVSSFLMSLLVACDAGGLDAGDASSGDAAQTDARRIDDAFDARVSDAATDTSIADATIESGRWSYRGLTIPTTHPRLFWNAERLARARAWFATNPFTPRSMSEPADGVLDRCMHYLLSGNPAYAREAIDWAVAYTIPAGQLAPSAVASDDARWNGEAVMIALDWCYPEWTPGERETVIARWYEAMEILRHKPWGGPMMFESNYNWGYARNMFELAVATYETDTASAQTFLDETIGTRWENAFFPYARSAPGGAGGVFQEGSNYGVSLADYPLVPFVTGSLLGRPLYDETSYWRDAVYYLVYATLPSPTFHAPSGDSFFELFPFADDQRFVEGGYVEGATGGSRGYGNFMQTFAAMYGDEPVGEYARTWIESVRPATDVHVRAVDEPRPGRPFATLPLDFYASGSQFFITRNQWHGGATVAHITAGDVAIAGGGHEHADVGGIQIWRSGRWLTRETAGYSNNIVGYGGTGSVDVNRAVAHNVIFVGGAGITTGVRDRMGPPTIRRLESRPAYSLIGVDLTPSYTSRTAGRGNPAAVHVEREVLFLRELETFVIVDRIESVSADDTKGFILHSELIAPVLEGAQMLRITSGFEVLRAITLVPAAPTRRIVAEGSRVGQHRVEIETSGAREQFFIHVLQSKLSRRADITASITESSAGFVIALSLDGRSCRVEVQRTMESRGGGVRCSMGGVPTAVDPFGDAVQAFNIGVDGPAWSP